MIWIICLFFIVADAYFNYYRIEVLHNNINHYFNGLYRGVFYLGLVWLYGMPLLQAAMFLLGAFCLHSILFNLGLNFLRHKPFDYLGKASLLDRLEAKMPWIVILIWKVIAASGFIYAFYRTDLL